MTSKDMMREADKGCDSCENSMRVLRMYNQLSASGKEKMINVLNVLLKAEYINEHNGLDGME